MKSKKQFPSCSRKHLCIQLLKHHFPCDVQSGLPVSFPVLPAHNFYNVNINDIVCQSFLKPVCNLCSVGLIHMNLNFIYHKIKRSSQGLQSTGLSCNGCIDLWLEKVCVVPVCLCVLQSALGSSDIILLVKFCNKEWRLSFFNKPRG